MKYDGRSIKVNLSEILSVNWKFIRHFTSTESNKTQTLIYLKFGFKCKKRK